MLSEFCYVRPEDVGGDALTLQKDEVHHLTRVLRKNKHDLICAVDGRGNAYECEIESFEKTSLKARILKRRRLQGEPVFHLTLAVAIPKKDRFEWILEKGTELGVARFVPVLTERTVTNGKAVKPQRCQRILLSAMKQCRRSVLPALEATLQFSEVCRTSGRFHLSLLAHEKRPDLKLEDAIARKTDSGKPENANTGILLIGPEGGFTEAEVAEARDAGFGIFGLGPRRLRTETAALTGAALILDRMGELS